MNVCERQTIFNAVVSRLCTILLLLWTEYPLRLHAREKQRIRKSSLTARDSIPSVFNYQLDLTIEFTTCRLSMRAQLTIQPHSSQQSYVNFIEICRARRALKLG
jgi:hypothetical protein